jgi:hypothetical protein
MTEVIADLSEMIHHNSKTTDIAIALLRIDRSYQRTPNQTLVDEIASGYDVIPAEMILVSDRGERDWGEKEPLWEGRYFIVSGQHRVLAARKKGLTKIHARVIDLSKEANPAALEAYYRRLANRRIQDRAIDVFKTRVVEGDPTALAIVKILDRFGVQINYTPESDRGLNSISTVELIYERDQGSTLIETLELIKAVYGEIKPQTAGSEMMKGFAWFISNHSLDVDQKRLIEKLQTLTPSQLKGRAAQTRAIMGKALWTNIYIVMVDLWNEKLTPRNQLQLNFKSSTLTAAAGGGHHRYTRRQVPPPMKSVQDDDDVPEAPPAAAAEGG